MSLGVLRKLRVQSLRKETTEGLVVALEIPQAFRKSFGFKHGQFLTLEKKINSEIVRRPYSICSQAVSEPSSLEIGIKKVPGGLFSSWAHQELSVGDELDVLPPEGDFTSPVNSESSRRYCCIAIGSGITPIMSILRTVLSEEPRSKVILIYGNRRASSTMFLDDLGELKNRYMDRLLIQHVFSREQGTSDLLSGRLKGSSVQTIVERTFENLQSVEFFICGPEKAAFEIHGSLQEVGVSDSLIHRELFGFAGENQANAPVRSDTAVGSSIVSLKYGGRTYEVLFELDHKNILEAGLEQGLELPYSCKAGACVTCRGVLREGEVNMGSHHVLDKASLAAGYVLTCQSRPISKRILIDFDYKK